MSQALPADPRFTDLWSTHNVPIRGYISSLVRDPAEAEDLTQETFLRVIRKVDTLRDETKVSSWLYRIATNLCYDRFRRSSRRKESVSLDAPVGQTSGAAEERTLPDTTAPPLERLLEQSEMSSCVQRTIKELPDRYRAVILLHDLEGMTDPEIADMLGCSLGAVKIRLHRARERLKSALEGACAFSTDRRAVSSCASPRRQMPLKTSETWP